MTKNILVTAAAVLLFVGAFVLRDARRSSPSPESDSPPASPIEAPLPRLVDLGSDQCIPCKKMAPILEELRGEYRQSFVVEFIDVWKNPDAGKPFGIRVIPTQIFIDASGEERFRHEGFLGKEAILAKWKELGVELTPAASAPGI